MNRMNVRTGVHVRGSRLGKEVVRGLIEALIRAARRRWKEIAKADGANSRGEGGSGEMDRSVERDASMEG